MAIEPLKDYRIVPQMVKVSYSSLLITMSRHFDETSSNDKWCSRLHVIYEQYVTCSRMCYTRTHVARTFRRALQRDCNSMEMKIKSERPRQRFLFIRA